MNEPNTTSENQTENAIPQQVSRAATPGFVFTQVSNGMSQAEAENLEANRNQIGLVNNPNTNDDEANGPSRHPTSSDVFQFTGPLQAGVFNDAPPKFWPSSALSYQLHLHFKELVSAWRLDSRRRGQSFFNISIVAEGRGVTAIEAGDFFDVQAFLETHGLMGFVTKRGKHDGRTVNELGYRPEQDVYYVILSTNFDAAKLKAFIERFRRLVNQLAIVADQRERAIKVDGGRYGLITATCFHEQENVLLNQIRTARAGLISEV